MTNQMMQLTKEVVEETKTSSLDQEWGNIFATKIETEEESTEFMQTLTNVLLSCVSRWRKIISSGPFIQENLGGESLFILSKKYFGEAHLLNLSISSALREIPSKHIRKLYLEILKEDGEVFEYFAINYKYLTNSEENQTDIREVQNSTLNLLKEIQRKTSTWPMEESVRIQLRISYYEKNIPPGYTPELFMDGPPQDRKSIPNLKRFSIGKVETGHHLLRLEAATTASLTKILTDASSNSSTVKLADIKEEPKEWHFPIPKEPIEILSSQEMESVGSSTQSTTTSKASRKRRCKRKPYKTKSKKTRKNKEEPSAHKFGNLAEERSDFERFKLSTIVEESSESRIVEENDDPVVSTQAEESPEYGHEDEIIPATPSTITETQPEPDDLTFAIDLSYKKNDTSQALKAFFEKEITLSESEFHCYCKFPVREDLFLCQVCSTSHHRPCYGILPKMEEPSNLCCLDCATKDEKLTCTDPRLMQFIKEKQFDRLILYGRYRRLRSSLDFMHEIKKEAFFKNFGIPKDSIVEAVHSLITNNVIKPSNVKDVFIVNGSMH